MSRNICVWLDDTSPIVQDEIRSKITAAAEKCGFVPYFYTREADAAADLPKFEVMYGHSTDLAMNAPNLKWMCCSWAGVAPFCQDGVLSEDCILTNSAGAYGDTIAEHSIMVLLMLLRRMPEYEEIVSRREWRNRLPIRSILGSRITVLGAGDIGITFSKRAKAMGAAHITGVSRSGVARDPIFDEMLPISRLEEILPETEILVMSLPGTAETAGVMDARRIAMLPEGAVIVNVGRGNSLDQYAVRDALNEGRLAGAAIDVFVEEPIPQDDPLWGTKNLIITPHIAGNLTLRHTALKNARMFCEDLDNYAAGRPLKHLVDRKRGY